MGAHAHCTVEMAGTVVCFLCHGFVPCTETDRSKFEKHMRSDHNAVFGLEFLLVACTMSEKQRRAVR